MGRSNRISKRKSREDEISQLIIQAIACNPKIKLLMYMAQSFQYKLWHLEDSPNSTVHQKVNVFKPNGEIIESRELYILYNHIVKLEKEIKWYWNGYYPLPWVGDNWEDQDRYFIQTEKAMLTALQYRPEMWK
jgi:hypothetical protein